MIITFTLSSPWYADPHELIAENSLEEAVVNLIPDWRGPDWKENTNFTDQIDDGDVLDAIVTMSQEDLKAYLLKDKAALNSVVAAFMDTDWSAFLDEVLVQTPKYKAQPAGTAIYYDVPDSIHGEIQFHFVRTIPETKEEAAKVAAGIIKEFKVTQEDIFEALL